MLYSRGLISIFVKGSSLVHLRTSAAILPKLYRYTKKRYGFADGRIRFNTLFGYQTGIVLNDAQKDLSEGLITVLSGSPDGWRQLVQIVSLDAWMLCFSTDLKRDLVDRFEADVVYEIDSHDLFCVIAEKMAPFSDNGSLDKVNYVDDDQLDTSDEGPTTPMALFADERFFARRTKSRRFEYQSEYRLSFEPRPRDYNKFLRRNQLQGGASYGFSNGLDLEIVAAPSKPFSWSNQEGCIAGLLPHVEIALDNISAFIKEVDI